jgi:hypothetical protein
MSYINRVINVLHSAGLEVANFIPVLTLDMDLLFTGTRFVHTSEGRFLVTRLVPCPRCVAASQADIDLMQHQQRGPDSWSESGIPSGALGQKLVAEVRGSHKTICSYLVLIFSIVCSKGVL